LNPGGWPAFAEPLRNCEQMHTKSQALLARASLMGLCKFFRLLAPMRTLEYFSRGHLRRAAVMAAYGALQPMAAGFAAGSDLAGTSGAGIARSRPISPTPVELSRSGEAALPGSGQDPVCNQLLEASTDLRLLRGSCSATGRIGVVVPPRVVQSARPLDLIEAEDQKRGPLREIDPDHARPKVFEPQLRYGWENCRDDELPGLLH
jgi:hypothetical protein